MTNARTITSNRSVESTRIGGHCVMPYFFRSRIFAGLAGLFSFLAMACTVATAQTETLLHNFAGGADGASPWAGVIFDTKGNLYGTTLFGGPCGCGNVFELTPTSGGGWSEKLIYSLSGSTNSYFLYAGLTIDPAGNLYGAAYSGSVFELRLNNSGTWQETDLLVAGSQIESSLVLDPKSRGYYGTNAQTVFKLTEANGGTWKSTVLFTFNGIDGSSPQSPMVLDAFGNIYGTTAQLDTTYNGNVFKLSRSTSGVWKQSVLYNFKGGNDGYVPRGNIVFDKEGNLYGTTTFGGTNDVGTVFKMSPVAGVGWNKATIYSFAGGSDAAFPVGGLVFGPDGNLYGTTQFGGGVGSCQTGGCGTVFKLTPPATRGIPWTETILHSFAGGNDGAIPSGTLVFDAAANIYGTTDAGGLFDLGTVFEITP